LLIFTAFSKHAKVKHPSRTIVKFNNNICIINNIWYLKDKEFVNKQEGDQNLEGQKKCRLSLAEPVFGNFRYDTPFKAKLPDSNFNLNDK
jgi:hypothetical protein